MEELIFLLLTRLTVLIHFMFIVFVVFGGLFILKKRWAVYAELASGVICPLTTLENYFGYRAGISTYEEDFVTRYLVPIIYQENIGLNIQIALVFIVISINLIAYGILKSEYIVGCVIQIDLLPASTVHS